MTEWTDEEKKSFQQTLRRVMNSEKWKNFIESEPDCGILACSPEIYAEMQEATKQHLKAAQDKSKDKKDAE